jgi:hypothetical protein
MALRARVSDCPSPGVTSRRRGDAQLPFAKMSSVIKRPRPSSRARATPLTPFADKAIAKRSSARFRCDQAVRYYANGFRIARDLD